MQGPQETQDGCVAGKQKKWKAAGSPDRWLLVCRRLLPFRALAHQSRDRDGRTPRTTTTTGGGLTGVRAFCLEGMRRHALQGPLRGAVVGLSPLCGGPAWVSRGQQQEEEEAREASRARLVARLRASRQPSRATARRQQLPRRPVARAVSGPRRRRPQSVQQQAARRRERASMGRRTDGLTDWLASWPLLSHDPVGHRWVVTVTSRSAASAECGGAGGGPVGWAALPPWRQDGPSRGVGTPATGARTTAHRQHH